MRKRSERGAVVMEATIALSAFIFFIYTILSILNICYIQSRISIAMNVAAKQISQYCYLYYKIGGGELNDAITDEAEEARQIADETVDGVIQIVDSLSDAENSASAHNLDGLFAAIQSGSASAESLIKTYGDILADDPMGFIIGIGKLAASEGFDKLKGEVIGKLLAEVFMKKNLKDFDGDDPEKFLQRYHVKDGMDGLDFKYSVLMPQKEDLVQLVVTYDVSVIKLLGIDYSFTFRQVAKSAVWGEGQ